jgi:hypothetical protein
MAPSRIAPRLIIVVRPYVCPSREKAIGIAVGIRIAIVPQLVPVANEVREATIKTIGGNQ